MNVPETYSCITHGGVTFQNINTPSGNTMNMNSGGDQIHFMTGGNWNAGDPTPNTHDASYTGGTILFAFSSTAGWSFRRRASVMGPALDGAGCWLDAGECKSIATTRGTDVNACAVGGVQDAACARRSAEPHPVGAGGKRAISPQRG